MHLRSVVEKIQTVLDCPLGLFLDKTINFLTYSIDDLHLKNI